MLYFFHHYELPVILQQAQLQQLLLRTHHGMGGMVGLAGIAALASGAAYHDAPAAAAATQAAPNTAQSTTQTVRSTAQSTTQTSLSVSTVQTNTTHTGDVTAPPTALAAAATPSPADAPPQLEERPAPPVGRDDRTYAHGRDSSISTVASLPDEEVHIKPIIRKKSRDEPNDKSDATAIVGSVADKSTTSIDEQSIRSIDENTVPANVEDSMLDRRKSDLITAAYEDLPAAGNGGGSRVAPRASPDPDDVD
ncbi:hypothetical protein EVAR_48418_1 [Eumeta japonica]|uniref:Uncharacterized protein n=1 Tax=Eumeta variegata TaxID=151549 RepID=A0A4C1XP59_EUMVA|nr:hypothetical protein EVAR_48418_1 [Eumeta japonica]